MSLAPEVFALLVEHAEESTGALKERLRQPPLSMSAGQAKVAVNRFRQQQGSSEGLGGSGGVPPMPVATVEAGTSQAWAAAQCKLWLERAMKKQDIFLDDKVVREVQRELRQSLQALRDPTHWMFGDDRASLRMKVFVRALADEVETGTIKTNTLKKAITLRGA